MCLRYGIRRSSPTHRSSSFMSTLQPKAVFGGFIFLMLVPVFAMYYKSRRIISAYNRNLATIQAQRRAEADRIMKLAQEAPEKLTRAERAAVEGKMAWKQSVASLQTVGRREGSVGSSGWSASGSGDVPSPSRGSTPGSSRDFRRDLEMGSPVSWPMTPSGSEPRAMMPAATTPQPTPETVQKVARDSQLEQPKTQGNSRVELVALHDLARKHRLDPAAVKDIELLLNGNGHPQRPTTSTDGNMQTGSPVSAARSASGIPEAKNTTPTTLYGFHLPRPQAVQAYILNEMQERADLKRVPLEVTKSPVRQLPRDLTLSTSLQATGVPMQLAVHSPKSPTRAAGDVPVPTVKPHVLQPIRRSATIRRANSASDDRSGKSFAIKRSKSGNITRLPSPSSEDFPHPNGIEAGPKWHRERMKRWHSSNDLRSAQGEGRAP